MAVGDQVKKIEAGMGGGCAIGIGVVADKDSIGRRNACIEKRCFDQEGLRLTENPCLDVGTTSLEGREQCAGFRHGPAIGVGMGEIRIGQNQFCPLVEKPQCPFQAIQGEAGVAGEDDDIRPVIRGFQTEIRRKVPKRRFSE